MTWYNGMDDSEAVDGESYLASERAKVFAERVASFKDARQLAAAFEVSEATVKRWMSGAAVPHAAIAEQVLRYVAAPSAAG